MLDTTPTVSVWFRTTATSQVLFSPEDNALKFPPAARSRVFQCLPRLPGDGPTRPSPGETFARWHSRNGTQPGRSNGRGPHGPEAGSLRKRGLREVRIWDDLGPYLATGASRVTSGYGAIGAVDPPGPAR